MSTFVGSPVLGYPDLSEHTMCFPAGAFAITPMIQNSPPIHNFRWDCVYCEGVNRWHQDDAPPNKCRHCGAPERM